MQLLGGHSNLEMAKTLDCDHRTIKKVANNVNKVKRNPLQTSKQVFDACGISGVNGTTWCQII